MKRMLLYLIGLLLIVANVSINAQDEDDSTYTRDKHKWNWNWDWEDNWGDWVHGLPSIEVNYGLGTPKHDKLNTKLNKVGLTEIKLGYVSFDDMGDNVTQFNEKFGFVSKIATSLQNGSKFNEELGSDMLRFGFGRRSGYGYDFRNVKILPYTQEAAVWSRLDMKEYPTGMLTIISPAQAEEDSKILDRFNKNFRFGTTNEGGIRIEMGRFMSLNAGYEASVIFPRHMVWKHIGSFIIEEAGMHALDNFIDEVMDSSPEAAPIVNFILKNGYSYLFYTLKKDKMNWPFNTEAPLTYETFKFGVTFTF